MKLALISFTEHGGRLCGQLQELLSGSGYDCVSYGNRKYAGRYGLQELNESVTTWAGTMFQNMDGILFIGAAGIAVRSIAPWLTDKTHDPAVVVMDEKGVFVISLLSGHLGGANELTGRLANLTGAIPVITTATDVNGRFAVDLFAKKNRLHISNMEYAKAVSADILDEKPVGLVCEFPVIGTVPEELQKMTVQTLFEGEQGIVISLNEETRPFKQTLHLLPKLITVGIGCRQGTATETVETMILQVLQSHHLSVYSIEQLVSLDLKAQEPALLAFCSKYDLPFITYTAEELRPVAGDFTASAFVEEITGVDNVCERSAVLGSGGGRMIQKKKAGNGVTISLAIKDWSVDFE